MTETRIQVPVERVTFTTTKTFDDVLAGIYEGVSRPDLPATVKGWNTASSYEEFEELATKAAGPSGLLQFLRLDQDAVLNKIPGRTPQRLVRLLVGNPYTMTLMTRHIAEAGSYAPVTLLVWEDGDEVRVAYDTTASLLEPYGNESALQVARELDDKVITLLRRACAG
ncbi:DUF302 domain-containing protein [Actinoplanes sp. Pm04-4]|uniref:DUF302 domain-containing protein n=1 Tax=Paractinoplanes pyxinae TaxID=2997416 RepID=A0ABT4AYV8_9ACTN|nr:DUF302 domain-containing protein [Actinoplanes pyxinae]MCY1139047.1 DUF302 domain-containing protein [Actinoplanes pyxinae]